MVYFIDTFKELKETCLLSYDDQVRKFLNKKFLIKNNFLIEEFRLN